MPLQPALVGDALRRISRASMTPGSGAEELVTYFVGQVVGSLTTVRPADRVLLDMVEEWVAVTTSRYEELVAAPSE
jgi:hypothetical protein